MVMKGEECLLSLAVACDCLQLNQIFSLHDVAVALCGATVDLIIVEMDC